MTPLPPIASQYMSFTQDERRPVPKELLLRGMTKNLDRDELGHRVDIVYVEGVLKSGYTCEDMGNLLAPSSDAIKSFIDAFKSARSGVLLSSDIAKSGLHRFPIDLSFPGTGA